MSNFKPDSLTLLVFLAICGSYLKCSLTPLEKSDHSNLPKNKVRGHATWAVDTEAPKTASVIDPGHKFHFEASFLSGNVHRTQSLPLLKNNLNSKVNGVKCKINFNLLCNITPPTVRKHTFKIALFTYLHIIQRQACK